MKSVFNYQLKTEVETIGDLRLQIQSLANLNETIDELFKVLERDGNPALLEALCPYFGVIWPAARGLAEHLVHEGGVVLRGQRVLEVGCGLALPSLVAARLGAHVTATDFHPDIQSFLERNVALNSIEGLKFIEWDWQAGASKLGTFDWVVGSDILYEKQHPGPVAKMLVQHAAPGARIILADPGRPHLQAFVDEMKQLGFQCQVLARTVSDLPKPREIFILEFFSAL